MCGCVVMSLLHELDSAESLVFAPRRIYSFDTSGPGSSMTAPFAPDADRSEPTRSSGFTASRRLEPQMTATTFEHRRLIAPLLLPTLAALAALAALAGCGAPEAKTDTPASQDPAAATGAPDITGHWVSDCVKVSEQQIMKLDFLVAKDTWTLDYSTFADAECKTKFLTVHIEGPYEIKGASAVAGAFDAKFGFARKTITPHIDAAAGFLGSDKGCGGAWTANTAVDMLDKGCPALGQYPGATCNADYDLVQTDGKTLRFGERPKDNNMCTEDRRPAVLSGLAMKKQG